MPNPDDNEYIYLSLLHLGAVGWTKAFKRLICALQYVTSHDTESAPIKHLYTELASAQNCTYSVIERSLRYVIGQIWEASGSECSKLLFHSSERLRRPSVSEFLLLYSVAFKSGTIQAWVDSKENEEPTRQMNIHEILKLL